MSDGPRVLLLQIRNADDPMREHEYECFLRAARLEREQLHSVDAVEEEFVELNVDEHDALMIGGSGDYSIVHSDAPFFEPLRRFLRDLVERDYPVFASCFGFQTIADALGGEVITDLPRMEVGGFPLELLEAGRRDPLFSLLSDKFLAQFGHKDRLAKLPQGAIPLVRGEHIACQAFRLEGKRIWATQFHPELSGSENRHRYMSYIDRYSHDNPDPDVMSRFVDSPEPELLLQRFLRFLENDDWGEDR